MRTEIKKTKGAKPGETGMPHKEQNEFLIKTNPNRRANSNMQAKKNKNAKKTSDGAGSEITDGEDG
jgi:hypothetical protein